MSYPALKRRAREARTWLHEACFPLWADAGVADNGLFRETLSLDHRPQDSATTRVRVQARQTYVFAEALRQGWEPDTARSLIEQGVAILSGPVLRADGLAGRTLDTESLTLADETADLYDIAFVLFALAHAERALGGGIGLQPALKHLAAVDAHLRMDGAGYREALPAPAHRAQNPQMHFFEACLALHTADPSGGHLARAAEILHLFETRFTAGPGGLLGERFAPDWSAPSGRDAEIVEPGHQFEWVWLAHAYARLAARPVSPRVQAMYAFANARGSVGGRVVMEMGRDGVPADPSARTWSQTEALKAHIAVFEASAEPRAATAAVTAFDVLMDQFLTESGGWTDHLGATGNLLSSDMPASTGYHVVLAFAELMRICPD